MTFLKNILLSAHCSQFQYKLKLCFCQIKSVLTNFSKIVDNIPSIVTGALAGLLIAGGKMPLFELPVLRLAFLLSILDDGLLPPLTGLVLTSNLPPEEIGGDNWPLATLLTFGLNPCCC